MNFKLGELCFENELISMSRAWDKEKYEPSTWPCSPWVLPQLARCLGGHRFESCRGLRFFLCPTLVTCWLFSHKSLKRLELVSRFFSDVLWDRKVPNLRSLHRRNRFYLFHLDDCARPHRPALSRLIIIIIVWDNSTVDGDCDVDIDA